MYAVLPAAGSGQRMGQLSAHCAKILLPAVGQTSILELTLKSLLNSGVVKGVALAVRPQDEDEIAGMAKEVFKGLDSVVVHGGESRQNSVFRALKAIRGRANHVLIHDAARPFCPPELIRKAAACCVRTGACLIAVPSKASVKLVKDGAVEATIPRVRVWEAQTPQAFEYSLVLRAHEKAVADNYSATDDSELVERLGYKVEIVEGSDRNIKITTPHDLEYAASVLAVVETGTS